MSSETTQAFHRVFSKYQGCDVGKQGCMNSYIRNLKVLRSADNLGYAGSFNTGIKVRVAKNVSRAIFSGDDVRFAPGRLKVANTIMQTQKACMYHFEGYSSYGITLEAVNLIGPMDENFWPAYCEDCDYWYRAQLAGCQLFYRGGYVPEVSTPASKNLSYMDHGDVKSKDGIGSATYRSDSQLKKLVANTLHPSRGRFAYLKRKWGFDVCSLYHTVLNRWRDGDETIDAMNYSALVEHGAKWDVPYNDSQMDLRHWIQEDWRLPEVVSSRAVNSRWAPAEFVWKPRDHADLWSS